MMMTGYNSHMIIEYLHISLTVYSMHVYTLFCFYLLFNFSNVYV